jgi:hypothetical protein
MSSGPTIPHPVIDCIAHDRQPNVREFRAVAEHIRSDLRGRGADAPKALAMPEPAIRVMSYRAAHAALTGCG